MTPELDKRWRASMPPFRGVTVYPADFMPLADAQPHLAVIVGALTKSYQGERLYTYHDWHEHDGYLTDARETSWNELFESVASVEAMLKVCASDYLVRTAFFPESRLFLFRFYLPDVYDNPYHSYNDPDLIHYIHFDLTCETPLAHEVAKSLSEGCALTSEDTKSYFDQRHSGSTIQP